MERSKYVIDSIQDNTEILAYSQEEQILQTSTNVVAARSKAKAKLQPRELVGNDSNHTNTRKKMD